MKADRKTEAEVVAALEAFADSYQKRDLPGVSAAFADEPDILIYGTGADEKRIGLQEIQAQAERDWAQADEISVAFDWTSVSAADGVAWAAVDGAFLGTVGGQSMRMPMRSTFVLTNRGGRWLIVQAHMSVPAPGQAEGASYPG
jgi:ketosteroid isomerase-like protein